MTAVDPVVRTKSARVFGILLAGALAAATLAPGQLATWADAHADRPGGAALAAVLDRWGVMLVPLDAARTWLHGRVRDWVERPL